MQIKTIVSCYTADSKPVKQEVNGTVILPSLVFPELDDHPKYIIFECGELENLANSGFSVYLVDKTAVGEMSVDAMAHCSTKLVQ